MSAGVSFSEATVTAPDGTVHEGVAVSTRQGVLTLRDQGGTVLLEQSGVVGVVRQSRKRWRVTIADPDDGTGSEWKILRTRCNCSGSV